MELNDKVVNDLINRYKEDIDSHGYPDNISHLLYLIVPAFIVYYGLDNERKILDTFKNVPIIIKDEQDKILQASYTSIPYNNEGNIDTKKYIILSFYENISLLQLLDNLVHEYNHALNSMIDEIYYDDEVVRLRTGLCFNTYKRSNFEYLSKDDDYILEEIINTKQTEEVINIINSFNNYNVEDSSISTTLYNIKTHIGDNYISDAYGLGSLLCRDLMNNRTFISTLANLRLKGVVNDLDSWFDNITGEEGSFNNLISLLLKSQKLEEELQRSFFKRQKIEKIRSIYRDAMVIIDTFNNNSNYRG